jgi:3-methyl-2-oxobutanoate hydroxymethyltransferase
MTESVLYGGQSTARVRIHHLQQAKERGEKWAMLTAYDTVSAAVFEEAGIPVLLVGDSAGNVVLGHSSTVPVTVEDILLMTKAVTRSTTRTLIVADLPFGSYEASPQRALETAVRMMKEGGAQAVKLEGGVRVAPQIRLLTENGIPVMAHVGFTPQSEHALGGFRVQGRGAGAERLLADAHAVQEAGAFAVVLEMVPAEIAGQVTKELTIPTIGIGAGIDCDAQVLVWPDMAGFSGRADARVPRFVKRYADLRAELLRAAKEYADDVRGGTFPGPEHSFE